MVAARLPSRDSRARLGSAGERQVAGGVQSGAEDPRLERGRPVPAFAGQAQRVRRVGVDPFALAPGSSPGARPGRPAEPRRPGRSRCPARCCGRPGAGRPATAARSCDRHGGGGGPLRRARASSRPARRHGDVAGTRPASRAPRPRRARRAGPHAVSAMRRHRRTAQQPTGRRQASDEQRRPPAAAGAAARAPPTARRTAARGRTGRAPRRSAPRRCRCPAPRAATSRLTSAGSTPSVAA